MIDYENYFNSKVNNLDKKGLRRKFSPLTFQNDRILKLNEREYINFSSNNYMSLSHDERLISAAKKASEKYGTGGSSSRYVAGNTELYDELEDKIAYYKNFESALVFTSGYTANVGTISAILEKGDLAVIDKLDHASIIDGVRLSKADFKTFRHKDYEGLKKILSERRENYKKVLIITESVFSMDGDVSDINTLIKIKKEYNALLMVDEAHASAVFGKGGRGMINEQNAKGVDIEIGTLSKGIPSLGGYIAGSKSIIEFVKNRARSLMYTTALPASSLAVSIETLKILPSLESERLSFVKRFKKFNEELKALGYETFGSESQIIPVLTGENEKTLRAGNAFKEKGIYAVAIRPPTVAKNKARLRFSLTRSHTDGDILRVLECIKKIISL